MRKRNQNFSKDKWTAATNRAHNLDVRIISLVRLIARKAAEKDYEKHLNDLKKSTKELRDDKNG